MLRFSPDFLLREVLLLYLRTSAP
ncbi:hypothetical protein LINPERPRIM_LOCUS6810 [Linum perenne]